MIRTQPNNTITTQHRHTPSSKKKHEKGLYGHGVISDYEVMRSQNGLVGKFLVLVGLSVFGFYNLGQWATNKSVNSQNGSDFVMIEQCKLCYNITSEVEEKVELKKPSEGQLYKIENSIH